MKKTENIKREFHQQDKLPSKLSRLQAASDALKVAEFQIAVSIIVSHRAVRSVDHFGEIMVTHGEGSDFMLFNNLPFF